MSAGTTHTSSLSYQTFISDPIPVHTTERLPNGDARMFSPITTTLVTGSHDCVLVDPPMTIAQTTAVGDWLAGTGKRLTYIYVTHGHGDHWFGTAPLLRRFPGATALATAATISMMHVHGSAKFRAALWDAQFPDQIPDSPVLATPPEGNVFHLEGHELRVVEVGHTDTDDTTVLHVPSARLVVAGDVIYNNVHQYLREAAGDGIESWLRAIDAVAELEPAVVIAGHKDGRRDDGPENIELTRRYLLDAQDLISREPNALQFFQAMTERYPDRLNPGAIWSSATALLN